MRFNVAQNTSFLTAASVIQKVISFVYFTLIARFVGVGNTGQYFFAIAFTTIFTVVGDLGLAPVLTREGAKQEGKIADYLATVLGGKILGGLGAYLLLVITVALLGYPAETRVLIYLSGVTMWFDNLHSAFYSVLRARRNLLWEAAGNVGSQLLTLGLGTVALLKHAPLTALIAAYTIPSILNTLYAATVVRRLVGSSTLIFANFKGQMFRQFLALGWPFALAGLLSRLYSYTDSVLISKLLPREHLGWWSVPYKIVFAFQFIPVALSASLYPALSARSLAFRKSLPELFLGATRYLSLLIFPLAAGLQALAAPIILFLYGPDFSPSIPVLRILLGALIFGYFNFITGSLLNAINHQKVQTGLLGLGLVVNVTSNAVLLPRLGLVGAALAALLGNAVIFAGSWWWAKRLVGFAWGKVARLWWGALWPALVMMALVHTLARHIHWLFTIPVGALVYGGLVIMNKSLPTWRWNELKNLLGRDYENADSNS